MLTQLLNTCANKGRIVFIYGNFNVVHPGHLRVLNFAAGCGDYLVVGVNNNNESGIFVPSESRLSGVQAIGVVDYAFLIDTPLEEILLSLRPAVVVKGREHEVMLNPERDIVKSYGGDLIFASGEAGFSSLDLLEREFRQVSSSAGMVSAKDYLIRHGISSSKLIQILRLFSKVKVVVVGDLIVDEYITCKPLGMSQEDPTVVVTPIHNDLFVGGAGVVARHAASLGASVSFFSLVGDDDVADYASEVLTKDGISTFFVVDKNRPTTLKQRFRAHSQTLLRVSHLKQHAMGLEFVGEMHRRIICQLNDADLLIFSDFNYGCLPQHLVDDVINACEKRGIPVVADSQSSSQIGDISRFRNALLATPTEREARLAMHDSEAGLISLADSLIKKSGIQNVLLTLGSEGVLIHSPNVNGAELFTDQIPALNPTPKDVSGAGDSMLVVSSIAMVLGASIWEAAYLGSVAASRQVSRVGNLPLEMSEIRAGLET